MMKPTKLEAMFNIGSHVMIDDDPSIKGRVTAICVRGVGRDTTYEVVWMHCGNSHSAWIDEWRLKTWAA